MRPKKRRSPRWCLGTARANRPAGSATCQPVDVVPMATRPKSSSATNPKGFNMLVLSRKRGQKIRINDDITITVIEVRGDKVRIGITAPPAHQVHRQEVYELRRDDAACNPD